MVGGLCGDCCVFCGFLVVCCRWIPFGLPCHIEVFCGGVCGVVFLFFFVGFFGGIVFVMCFHLFGVCLGSPVLFGICQ